jgi:hypothetical protein
MSANISTKVIIEDEGTVVSSNNIVNFTGAGVSVSNVGGAATIVIPGPGVSTGLTYKGLWDANLNNPLLTSGVGTVGNYYVVSTAGTTNLNGTTDWQVGDWAIFVSNAPDEWVKIDNHDIQAYNTVKDESTTLPQRSTLKFEGTGVTASDIGGETVVTIPIQPAYTTIQEEGSALTQQPIIDFQGTGVTATNGSGKTIVTIPGNIPTTSYGLFAQTADGGPVTGTIVETTIIGPGVGTLSVPANAFQIGDSFTCALDGLISCISSGEIEVRIKTLSGALLADTGIIDLAAATNKSWILNLYFTIRTLGGPGIASISSGGLFSYIRNGGTQFEGYVLSQINNIDFDTTINNTLVITVQWNTTNAGNSILSRNFTLQKIY